MPRQTSVRRHPWVAAAMMVPVLLACGEATQPARHPVEGTWTGAPPSTTPSLLTLVLEDGGQAQDGQPNVRRIQGTALDKPLVFPAVNYTVTGTFEAPLLTLTLSYPQRAPVFLVGRVRGDSLEATLRILDGEPSETFMLTRAAEEF